MQSDSNNVNVDADETTILLGSTENNNEQNNGDDLQYLLQFGNL